LGEALRLAEQLYAQEKHSVVSPETAVRAWGYQALHGIARSNLAAMRQYGLTEKLKDGIRLSDTAIAILHPIDANQRADALRSAATSPELFQELASYDGASDGNLTGRLVQKGFTPDGAKKAIAAFRASMSLVDNEAESYSLSAEDGRNTDTEDAALTPPRTPGRPPLSQAESYVFPLPGGASAQITVIGGPLTLQGVEMLKGYLSLAAQAIATDSHQKEEASTQPSAD
jgi:hypothetical protein